MMFLGFEMTPAAAERLKMEGIPQSMAVCVPLELWDDYVLGETPIHRHLLAMQLIADLREAVSNGTGLWAMPEVTGSTVRGALVKDLLHGSSVIENYDHIIGWINKQYIKARPPQVAVTLNGKLVRVLLRGTRLTGKRGFRSVAAGPAAAGAVFHSVLQPIATPAGETHRSSASPAGLFN